MNLPKNVNYPTMLPTESNTCSKGITVGMGRKKSVLKMKRKKNQAKKKARIAKRIEAAKKA